MNKVILLFLVISIGGGVNTLGEQLDSGFRRLTERFLVDVSEGDEIPASGLRYLSANCLRQKGNRDYAYPVGEHRLLINPPVFTWPMDGYVNPTTFPHKPELKPLTSFSRYGFELSRDSQFLSSDTLRTDGLRMPFFNPHTALDSGDWFWRYRIEKNGEVLPWSKTFKMNVSADVPMFESPQAMKAYHMLPTTYPRVYRGLDGLESNAWNRGVLDKIYAEARVALKKSVDDYVVRGKSIPKDATQEETEQIMKFRLKYEVGGVCQAIKALMQAYVLDENEDYLNKALELSNDLLSRNLTEIYVKSDFSGAQIMTALASVYDLHVYAWPLEKRKPYESAIASILNLIIIHQLEGNVGSADGILAAHFFQHIYLDAFKAAIILKGHDQNDSLWFDLLYNIWLARTPGGGFLDDGAWPNGNEGYLHVNMESMVDNYLFFKGTFGINLFKHPWYKNCNLALLYTFPPGSAGDGFGDGAENTAPPGEKRADFAYILGRETGNHYAIEYAYQCKKLNPQKPYRFTKNYFSAYRLEHEPAFDKGASLSDLPTAAVFPETGVVTMNTSLAQPEDNLFVAFRSSPFGVGSHGHADHNSFNIVAKGKPIFYQTGYRITSQDKHYLLCQKHTRGKNSILVDGKTQTFGQNGYGWIARFLHGERISYTMGDASRAYQPLNQNSINWETVLRAQDAYTPDEGFILSDKDDPKVKTFRRHIALLRPSTIVIYDELEAEKPVTWTWMLNGLESSNMSIDTKHGRIIADTDWTDAAVHVFASCPTRQTLSDEYYITPVDWLNPQRGRKAKTFDKRQYFSKTENVKKKQAMRYFSVLQIDLSNDRSFEAVEADEHGVYRVNGYSIKPEMDMSKPGRLEVVDETSGARLLYGAGESGVFEKREYTHSTLLYENSYGLQESADTFPLMVPLD